MINENEDKYLRLPHVLKIVPVSRSTWYRGIASGIYPKQIKLSSRVAAWKSSEVKICLEKLDSEKSHHGNK